MRTLRIPLLVLFFLAIGTSGLSAQSQRLPSIQQIVDRGEISVAIIKEDMPPMIMTDKTGKLSGFDISLARVIGRELGIKVKFVRVPTFDGVISHVAAKKADIGLSLLSRNTRRAQIVRFSRPYVQQSKTLLINRVRGLEFRDSCPTIRQLIQMARVGGLIGVVAGTSHESDIRRVVKDAKLVRFDAFDEMLNAVSGGKLMATMQGEVAARYFLHANPHANIRLKLCDIGSRADYIGIAVRPDAPDFVEWLNVLLDELNLKFDADVLIGQDPERKLP